MASIQQWTKSMAPKDKQYYQALGQRVAAFRKAQNLTQQKLAEILEISQQTMAHYEVGRLRVAVSMLPTLARILAVSVEDLVDVPVDNKKCKRGPASRLQRQIEQIGLLPKTKQRFVSEMLDTVLQQATR